MDVYKKILFKNRNIHHKNLKVIYESNDITYSSKVSVYQRHLRFLMKRYKKVYPKQILNFMWSYLDIKTCLIFKKWSLSKNSFDLLWYKCKSHGGSLIWNNFPVVVKSSNSLFEFKNEFKDIGNTDRRCLICRDTWLWCFILFCDLVGIY